VGIKSGISRSNSGEILPAYPHHRPVLRVQKKKKNLGEKSFFLSLFWPPKRARAKVSMMGPERW